MIFKNQYQIWNEVQFFYIEYPRHTGIHWHPALMTTKYRDWMEKELVELGLSISTAEVNRKLIINVTLKSDVKLVDSNEYKFHALAEEGINIHTQAHNPKPKSIISVIARKYATLGTGTFVGQTTEEARLVRVLHHMGVEVQINYQKTKLTIDITIQPTSNTYEESNSKI